MIAGDKPISSISETALSRGLTVDTMLREAAAAGFDGIELQYGTQDTLTPQTTESDCRRIRRHAEESRMQIVCLAVAASREADFVARDPVVRQCMQDRLRHALDLAAWCDCPFVSLGFNAPVDDPVQSEDAQRLLIQEMLELRFEAEQRAVRIELESGVGTLLTSPVEMREFVDACNSPWIGCGLNTSLANQNNHVTDWVRTLGHRLHIVHAVDVPPASHEGGALDTGDVELAPLLNALEAAGFRGPIVWHAGPGQDLAALHRCITGWKAPQD